MKHRPYLPVGTETDAHGERTSPSFLYQINRLAHIAVSINWLIPACLLPDVSTITMFSETYKEDEKQHLLQNQASSLEPIGMVGHPARRMNYV